MHAQVPSLLGTMHVFESYLLLSSAVSAGRLRLHFGAIP
jgi:hypothetical protein